MRLITSRDGMLQTGAGFDGAGVFGRSRSATGVEALDALTEGGLARGAVHELLFPEHSPPLFLAALLASSVRRGRAVAWSDPLRTIYPPAMVRAGIALDSLLVLRPKSAAEELWALAECLRCPGVGVTVASPALLSRVEARRLQLAAEAGGGVGLLLRAQGTASAQYAAATRWAVSPLPGEGPAQRWRLELVHGHGGRSEGTVVLEVCRETNAVRAIEELADRQAQTQMVRRRA